MFDLWRGSESRKMLAFLATVGAIAVLVLTWLVPATRPRAVGPVSSPPAAAAVPASSATAAAVSPASSGAAAVPAGVQPGGPVPDYAESSGDPLAEAAPVWTDLVGVMAKLGLVLALMLLALRGLQRVQWAPGGRSGRASRSRRAIEVVESSSLGQGMGVFLVAVGQRMLLIGGTSQQITLLAELDDPALLAPASGGPAVPGGDFDRAVSETRRGRGAQ